MRAPSPVSISARLPPWRASSPNAANASRRTHAPLAPDHFRGELNVSLAAGAAIIVEQHGLAVRRRLGHAHIARNDRGIDLLAEHAADVVHHLVRQAGALVVHGEHDAMDLELRVEADPDLL